MSNVSLMIVTSHQYYTEEIFTDVSQWFKGMEPHEFNDINSCIDNCRPGDRIWLAGHYCCMTEWSDAGKPVFQPVEH